LGNFSVEIFFKKYNIAQFFTLNFKIFYLPVAFLKTLQTKKMDGGEA